MHSKHLGRLPSNYGPKSRPAYKEKHSYTLLHPFPATSFSAHKTVQFYLYGSEFAVSELGNLRKTIRFPDSFSYFLGPSFFLAKVRKFLAVFFMIGCLTENYYALVFGK